MAGIVVEDAIMDLDLFSVLVGAAAIEGGIIGGWVQGWAWYHYEQKRAAAEKRERWREIALEWADTGRKKSLRRADLRGADLRGVDLGPGEGGENEADLSFADLSKADLRGAMLTKADLTGANLQGAKLWGAKLQEARLSDANFQGAKCNNATKWPDGFTPPPEAVNVDAERAQNDL